MHSMCLHESGNNLKKKKYNVERIDSPKYVYALNGKNTLFETHLKYSMQIKGKINRFFNLEYKCIPAFKLKQSCPIRFLNQMLWKTTVI